jgi:single-strand DNA-binding protein
MAEGLNKVMLLGKLSAPPELRSTQGGASVLKLRIATTERYLDQNKEWKERTEWHSVSVWGKRGEALHRLLAKDETVFIEGSLRHSSYEKDGVKHYTTDIVAENVLLTGSRPQPRPESFGTSPPAHAPGPVHAAPHVAPPATTHPIPATAPRPVHPTPARPGAATASKSSPPPPAPSHHQEIAPPDDYDDYNGADDDVPFLADG